MNSEPAPLVNKLILLVLSGILACLVLLVARAYRPAPVNQTSADAPNVEVADSVVPEESTLAPPAPPKPALARPNRLVTTNASRQAEIRSPAPSQLPVNSPQLPDARETTAVPVVQVQPVVASVPIVSTVAPLPAPVDASIFGTVTLAGTPPPEVPIDFGPSCGRLQTGSVSTRHYMTGPGRALANVLVYVKAGLNGNFDPPGATPLLDQVGCMFEPCVLAVMAGQPFQIRNSDPEFHNLHATPGLNREFNFAQPSRGRLDTKRFDVPELFIRIKCDVHPWMFAHVNVIPHPFFSMTDTNGFFALPAGLPPGRYTLSAVHLRAGEQVRELEMGAGGQKAVGFQMRVDGGRVAPNIRTTKSPTNTSHAHGRHSTH